MHPPKEEGSDATNVRPFPFLPVFTNCREGKFAETQGQWRKAPFTRFPLCLAVGKPLGPGDYPEVRPRILVQHRKVLQ
jgi:hypothetical protein